METSDCRNCHQNSGLVRDVAADVYGGPRVVPCFCYRTRTACGMGCPCARLATEATAMSEAMHAPEKAVDHVHALHDLLACARACEPDVRMLGNVRAEDAGNAIEFALNAIVGETARELIARYAKTVKEQAEHANAKMDGLRKELRHLAEKVGDAARILHAEGGDRYESGDHRQGRLLYEAEGVLMEAVVRLHVLSFGEA